MFMNKKKFDKRNYIANLTNNTTRIDELMKSVISDSKNGKLLKQITLRNIWKETVGELINRETVKIFEKEGKLYVKLRSAAAKSEVLLIKEQLLNKFNDKYKIYGTVKTIILI